MVPDCRSDCKSNIYIYEFICICTDIFYMYIYIYISAYTDRQTHTSIHSYTRKLIVGELEQLEYKEGVCGGGRYEGKYEVRRDPEKVEQLRFSRGGGRGGRRRTGGASISFRTKHTPQEGICWQCLRHWQIPTYSKYCQRCIARHVSAINKIQKENLPFAEMVLADLASFLINNHDSARFLFVA